MSATDLVARVERATPATRDRAIDGLRALAILGVVIGHWFVMALTVSDGSLQVTSPLAAMPGFAPLSWVLQMLGLFFLVGGYSATRSWERARARGQPYRSWLKTRVDKLVRPVLAASAVLAGGIGLAAVAGVPSGTLRTAAVLIAQPFWFIGVYAVITALTPVALALDRRLGLAAALPPVVIVTVVDFLRYGPWAGAMPGWLGLANVLPGWSFAYLLGVAWARGRFRRTGAALLAAAGLAAGLLLVLRFGYPVSMVGVPGTGRANSHPPSLLVIALAAAQTGLAIAARERIATLLRRPRLWTTVALINLSAMRIFCWHMIVLVAVSGLGLWRAGPQLPGLLDAPDHPHWVLDRLVLLPVYGAALAGVVTIAHRHKTGRR